MEIHTSLDEITDTLKKLKDADPADFHNQDSAKQDIVTVTTEMNLQQGEAVVTEEEECRTIGFWPERGCGVLAKAQARWCFHVCSECQGE